MLYVSDVNLKEGTAVIENTINDFKRKFNLNELSNLKFKDSIKGVFYDGNEIVGIYKLTPNMAELLDLVEGCPVNVKVGSRWKLTLYCGVEIADKHNLKFTFFDGGGVSGMFTFTSSFMLEKSDVDIHNVDLIGVQKLKSLLR